MDSAPVHAVDSVGVLVAECVTLDKSVPVVIGQINMVTQVRIVYVSRVSVRLNWSRALVPHEHHMRHRTCDRNSGVGRLFDRKEHASERELRLRWCMLSDR